MEQTRNKETLRILRYDDKFRQRGFKYICGVDEAGRGPLAGPVVASAVVFERKVYINGVYDSKKLSPSLREKLYKEIVNKALTYGIGVVSNLEIDTSNILDATKKAINTAIKRLGVKPDLLIVDGNFYKNDGIKVLNLIRGDQKSFSVASASILAKVTRDNIMRKYENMFPQYSFSQHKGYGTKKHIEEIKNFGFSEIHRLSFKLKTLQ